MTRVNPPTEEAAFGLPQIFQDVAKTKAILPMMRPLLLLALLMLPSCAKGTSPQARCTDQLEGLGYREVKLESTQTLESGAGSILNLNATSPAGQKMMASCVVDDEGEILDVQDYFTGQTLE